MFCVCDEPHGIQDMAVKKKNDKVIFIANTAVMAAVAIALSIAESLIPPMPMVPPGGKLGLSNIAVMLGADMLGFPSAMLIAVIKSVFAGVTRGFTAFIMSLSGGVVSALVMIILLRRATKKIGYIGIGVCGAVTHNLTQLAVSSMITTDAVFVYLPALTAMAIVTGAVTGTIMGVIIPHYRKLFKK